MTNLLAYFDPGSGSLLLQALVGGTAGLFVFGKYLWNSTFSKTRFSNRGPASSDSKSHSGTSSGEIPIHSLG